MKYSHIVFDIDGTLIDTEKTVLMSCQKMLFKLRGEKKDLDELRFVLGITGRDALLRFNIKDIDYAKDLWDKLFMEYSNEISIFNGIVEVLKELKSKQIKLGIVTSETNEEYESIFLKFKLDKYFDTVICADDTNEHKPSGQPIKKYLQRADAEREETLYIGDSPYDMQCAKNAGIDSALALWGRKDSGSINAKYYLKSPNQILNI